MPDVAPWEAQKPLRGAGRQRYGGETTIKGRSFHVFKGCCPRQSDPRLAVGPKAPAVGPPAVQSPVVVDGLDPSRGIDVMK